jgi:hypothetical protein
MEKARRKHVMGIPVSNKAFGIEEPDFPSKAAAYHISAARNPTTAAPGRGGKLGKTAGNRVAQDLKEHGMFLSSFYQTFWIILLSFLVMCTKSLVRQRLTIFLLDDLQ